VNSYKIHNILTDKEVWPHHDVEWNPQQEGMTKNLCKQTKGIFIES